ncbi:hypothetical protein AVEN_230466-1 [Araneus ventricosus]|uniref:Uncharacterized protein n=1 Tax=Araneus ventricosus TaxID=182803 RepID=A0A4Y2RJE1_ARAVE|nr:hypothetical protein AVEN_230466-1 [Araneus ventricosus]
MLILARFCGPLRNGDFLAKRNFQERPCTINLFMLVLHELSGNYVTSPNEVTSFLMTSLPAEKNIKQASSERSEVDLINKQAVEHCVEILMVISAVELSAVLILVLRFFT